MGVITEICQFIDLYNTIEQAGYTSFKVKFQQRKLYKRIYKTIDRLRTNPLTIDMMCDFFYNYIATRESISLDNCECIDSSNPNQFIFTIKSKNGTVSYSVAKYLDPNIYISIKEFSKYERQLKYANQIMTNSSGNEMDNVGFKCGELLKECISVYLVTRLNLRKKRKEE